MSAIGPAPALRTDPVLDRPPAVEGGRQRRWLREVGLIAAFYGVYSVLRDLHGEALASRAAALHNARLIIALERHLGLYHELGVQRLFLPHRGFIELWDGYYGTVHFVVAGAVLVYLYVRHPHDYRLWRNALAATTALALAVFAAFPVLPPRLLPARYGFTDTLHTVGGLWDFSSGAIDELSNQFAAMPSLHTAWSLWCTVALASVVRSRWARAAMAVYPAATVFCIVVTGNHYVADAVAGALCLALAHRVARTATVDPAGVDRGAATADRAGRP